MVFTNPRLSPAARCTSRCFFLSVLYLVSPPSFRVLCLPPFQVSTTFHTSSGDTNDFQRFSSFADGGALMVTTVVLVGYGNSLNDWNR